MEGIASKLFRPALAMDGSAHVVLNHRLSEFLPSMGASDAACRFSAHSRSLAEKDVVAESGPIGDDAGKRLLRCRLRPVANRRLKLLGFAWRHGRATSHLSYVPRSYSLGIMSITEKRGGCADPI